MSTSNDTPKPDKKVLQITFYPAMLDRLQEMAKYRGISIPTVIRLAIETEYDQFSKKLYGYKGVKSAEISEKKMAIATKKDRWAEKIAALESLGAPELEEHLLEIGYFSPATIFNPPNIYAFDRIRVGDDGSKMYVQEHRDMSTPGHDVVFRRDVFTFQELVSDLKKKNLL